MNSGWVNIRKIKVSNAALRPTPKRCWKILAGGAPAALVTAGAKDALACSVPVAASRQVAANI